MPAEPSPLVGRASLLQAIGHGAREGTGAVLIGAAGSGGTRILADAFAATRRAGLRSARMVHTPGSVRGATLVPLPDAVAQRTSADDPPTLLGLQVVFLDDAHLLDEQAGSLLIDLARSGTAVVANATGLSGMPPALRKLLEEGRASAIELAPLSRDEIAELAGHLLGDPVDGELAGALALASGGRPGTLSEVVDAGVDAGAIALRDGLWRLAAPLPISRSIRAAVLDAFTELSPEQRGWVATVARAGTLADDLAARIATSAAIAAVEDAGWTERVPDRSATRMISPAIGTAVLDALDRRARVAVLRRLVAAAGAAGRALDTQEQVALALWRLELGEDSDPAQARALAAVPGIDPIAKETLLRAAVDGGVPANAELADHLRRTRRPVEALALIDAALPAAASDDQRVALIRVRAMTIGVIERRSADALAALDASIEETGPHPDLLATRAAMLLLEGRPSEAVDSARTSLTVGESSPFARGFALLQLALGHRELGDLPAALDHATRLAASAGAEESFADGAALARWLPWEITVAIGAETNDVEAPLTAAHDAVPPEWSATRRPPLSYTLALTRLLRGDPAGAVRLLREADAGTGSWRDGWQPRILAELANALTLSGALEDASGVLERLGRLSIPPVQRARGDLAAAQLLHARGDAAAARALAAETAVLGTRAGLVLDAFDATWAGLRYGDETAPRRLLDLGARPSGTGRDAQRAFASALIDGGADAIDQAAVRLWDAGLRLHAIEGASRAAALGSTDAATRLVAWLTRTPSLRLRGVGDRRSAGLTAREREVALLAAGGYSDRAVAAELGITLRTAQTHLGRALAKLGVHRRTELRGLIEEP